MKKSRFSIVVIGFFILTISVVVYAAVGLNRGYRVNTNGSVYSSISRTGILIDNIHTTTISEWTTEKTITKSTCPSAVFIPTKTEAEYIAWYTNHPSCLTVVDTPQCGLSNYGCTVGSSTANSSSHQCGRSDCSPTERETTYTWNCNNLGAVVNCNRVVCSANITCAGGCFIAGTQITMADGSKKDITLVTTGNLVIGSKNSINTVVKLYKIWYQRKLYAFNGSNNYFVSDTHPFLTTEGWKSFYPAGSKLENPDLDVTLLEVGDILITEHGQLTLNSFDSIIKPGYVYNFKTNGSHDYIADGYVVHNPAEKPPGDCTANPRATGCPCNIDPNSPECFALIA